MAKNNLAKTFIRSTVRQVGRDAGKVVSNKVFGDSHSTPIRIIRNADTTPMTSDSGIRKYRHSLDRVVNSDLPSTKASAKKALITLENAFQEFISSNNQIINATVLEYILAWIDKALDYVDDVNRIVTNVEVEKIVEEVSQNFNNQRKQIVDAVNSLVEPVTPDTASRKRTALYLFLSPFCLIFFMYILNYSGLINIENLSETFLGILVLTCLTAPFVSISLLLKNRKLKKQHTAELVMFKKMKSLI